MPGFLSRLFLKSPHTLALENAPQAILCANEHQVVTFFNLAAEQLWGYSKASIIGQPLRNLFAQAHLDAADSNQAAPVEVQVSKADGKMFWVELVISRAKVGSGFQHTVFVLDVTRERFARELANQTLEQAMDAVVSIDENNMVTFFNKAAERMWGYSRSEVLGNNVKMLVPQSIQSQHDGFVDRNRKTGENRIVGSYREIPVPRKDGTSLWGQAAISKIEFDGRITYTAFFKDVTEEVEKREKMEMLSLVADHANSGIVITDANGKIEYLNAGFEKLAGYGLEEARGKKPGPMLQGIATLVGETNQRVEALAASLAKIDG